LNAHCTLKSLFSSEYIRREKFKVLDRGVDLAR
jgi:hypothetical protein